ncbi:O-antigen ligase family protein [Lentibacillus salinarum]|uniref:O-antigen ligase family protein n=1 Tax=Lentibacillus salinarum TaxID=446820 RepID=A0ABW4A103_9BACI
MTLTRQHHLTVVVEKMFIYFILLQPALDVLAYVNVPFSTPLRGLAMAAGIVYICLLPQTKTKKAALFYVTALGLFMLVHVITNAMVKEPFNLSLELTYMIKTIFFIVLLIVYVLGIPSITKQTNWQQVIQLMVLVNMTFIAAVMLLANLTGTGHRSYGALAKEGHSGWFFSGNELSAILGMGFGIVILYWLQKKSRRVKILLLPVIGLIIWAMLTIGTKVSFGSVLVVLGTALVLFLMKAVTDKYHWFHVIMLSAILAGTLLITPTTPIGHNLNLSFSTGMTEQPEEVNPVEEGETTRALLSGRKDFLYAAASQYREASVLQQLFGLGFGGNYEESPKLIEMDFLDWYFNFGLVGFTLFMLPLALIGWRIFKTLMRRPRFIFNESTVLAGVSVCLGLGSAFVAGHILSSPAASIYLALLIGYLYTLSAQPLIKNGV